MTVDQLKPNQVQRGLDFPEPVEVHAQQNPAAELSICGVEKTDETGCLYRLNLAVHGLEGEIKRAGFVMANSASDARSSEQELPRQFIKSRAVEEMVAVCPRRKRMSRGEQTRTNSVVSKPGIILLTMRISTPIP